MTLRKKPRRNEPPVAHPIHFNGPGVYQKNFKDTDYGVIFEDDGDTGYVYATNASHSHVHDAVHVYSAGDRPSLESEMFIVWHEGSKKAGLFYSDRFQAIVDFGGQRACSRSGLSWLQPEGSPWNPDHRWIEGIDEEFQ